MSLPAAPASRRKHGRVGGVADRQVGGLEDLVAVKVRDRDLGRGDQVEVVAGDDVHLVFLVRDLAGATRGVGVDDDRRPDLGHAVLGDVDVEEPVDQRPLERGTRALVDREAGAGDLRAAGQVDDVERLGDLPVGPPSPRLAAGGRVRADLAVARLLDGSSSPQVRTVTLASSPPTGTSGSAGFGMRSSRSSTSASTVASSASISAICSPAPGRFGLERSDFRAVRRRAALDRLADLLRGRVAAPPSARRRRRAASGGGRRARAPRSMSAGSSPLSIAPLRIASASSRSRCSPTLMPHRRPAPGRPRGVARPRSRGSRLASSQPARGPFGRPRNAR